MWKIYVNSAHSPRLFVQGCHWIVLFADWRCRRFWGIVDAWARTTAIEMVVSIVNILTCIVSVVTAVIVELALAVRREP